MAQGKRAGSRRAAPPPRTLNTAALAYAGGITLCVIAWGYLVYAAIDFGSSARAGNAGAWLLLILAGAGAATCLFVGLMLFARLGSALGATRPPQGDGSEPPRPTGGRRAAR
ncbi:hypothetical protein [Nocardioides daphniae]|uniref:Uncharacterized protein n=1 Tax=Nocardioides daphniae TaxID=402297 RepID=A0A4P7UDZ0_9ACTN|nr:hypothetical protein [Nocardioides daphniae]QCC78084.1 hypothetical protein E2C04_14450 [Nocardioides daphniae]GGD22287.1 hypothetical protein GCM10007231_21730 [Nocardioides daphniae]